MSRLGPQILTLVLLAACGSGGGGSSDTGSNTGGGVQPAAYSYQVPAHTGDGWTVAHAADQGMSVQGLEDMMDAIEGGAYPIVDSVAIAHQGRLVFSETIRTVSDSFDAAVNNNDLAMHAQFSVSKSIVSILVGISIDAGNIDGVATPYLDLFSYSDYGNWDDRKNDLSILDVLTMQTGLEWDEWDPPYSAADNRLITFYREEVDYSKGLLDLPMSADPGSSFVYNTVASISLGQAVENSSALSLVDFMQTYLFVPLGIVEASWEETPTALPNLGSGLHLYTRDLAKFGQMYMDGGSWNGNEIVSSEWVTASLQPHVEMAYSSPEGRVWLLDGYGYQWWIGHFDLEGTTYPTYAARGYGQQTLMIIPDLELVVAVNAHAYEELESQANQVFDLIATHVIPAAS